MNKINQRGEKMATSVKTAISLHKNLFDQVSELANEMSVSRSRLFALAVEDFIKKNENRKLLEKINAACDDHPDDEEKYVLNAMKKKHKKNIEREEW